MSLPRLALLLALLPSLAQAGTLRCHQDTPSAARALLGVGDSILNGYGVPSPLLTAVPVLGADAFTINAGYPGENSTQISARWLASEATVCGVRRCTHVWLEGGVNDLRLTATLPAVIASNMASAVDDALAKGYVVVWSDILPCRGDAQCTAPVAANILTYNALVATECATAPRSLNPRLRCIFGYAAFEDPGNPGYLLPAYSRDELHLSVAGSAVLGDMVGAALVP